MATERQIAANRANALRSTGPKTLAGKSKSSRNAYRHGLSSPVTFDPLTSAKVDAIVQAVAGKVPNQEKLTSAAEFARAQLELLRIRSKRAELMAEIDLACTITQDLQRLAALDRYERYALTKRRRASIKF